MENTKLLELARKQRMNTDVRKNVFLVMMTSEVSNFKPLLPCFLPFILRFRASANVRLLLQSTVKMPTLWWTPILRKIQRSCKANGIVRRYVVIVKLRPESDPDTIYHLHNQRLFQSPKSWSHGSDTKPSHGSASEKLIVVQLIFSIQREAAGGQGNLAMV